MENKLYNVGYFFYKQLIFKYHELFKKKSFWGGLVFCLVFFFITYLFAPSKWSWQNFLFSISVALFQLWIGTMIVERYLANSVKNKITVLNEINADNFFNDLTNKMGKAFGSEYEYLRINILNKNISPEVLCKYIDVLTNKNNENFNLLLEDMKRSVEIIKVIISTGALNDDEKLLHDLTLSYMIYLEIKTCDLKHEDNYFKIAYFLEYFGSVMKKISEIGKKKNATSEKVNNKT